ncbi:hypothetical protein Sjap_010891 [Stephania japonica]|uniref:Uncharacterized protein n=1 Tax=Stephania japonica TaxID=461633 RepID=A0AAP0P4Z7_9MAGN
MGRDYTHPTDVCPYEPEYESYPYWGNASPQPDLSYPFSSPLTPRQDKQSLDMFKEYSSVNQRFHQDILQYQENMEQRFKDINSNFRSIETLTSKINDTPNRMLEEEEFPVLLSCDEKETLNDVTLKSVETNEHAMNEYFAIDVLTPCIYEYWSDHEESEGELEVFQLEPEIVMAQTYEVEAEIEIEVTLTRLEELQQESKDDQSFVFVNPPTLPYIFDDFDMEVDEKERSKTFYTADTFVLDDSEIIDSFVLEVPNTLPFLNKGVSVLLPNAEERVSFLDTLYWKASSPRVRRPLAMPHLTCLLCQSQRATSSHNNTSPPLMCRHVTSLIVSFLSHVDRPRDACPHKLPDLRTTSRESLLAFLDRHVLPLQLISASSHLFSANELTPCQERIASPPITLQHVSKSQKFTNHVPTRQQRPENT